MTALHCPFSSRINPHAEAVQAGTFAWLHKMGFQLDHERMAGLVGIGHLAARGYPDATVDDLQLASDWTTLMALIDSHAEYAQHPRDLEVRNFRLVSAFEGVCVGFPEPVYEAMRDIGHRLEDARQTSGLPHEWRQLFRLHVEQWLGSHVWEARNRLSKKVPRPEVYVHMRQLSIGMHIQFTLAELMGRYYLPKEVRNYPMVQRLERLAVNLIAWANDILTLNKELAVGDFHNLVLSIHQSRSVSFPRAHTLAVNMHNLEVQHLVTVVQSLPQSPVWSPELASYVEAIQHWIAGHLQWGQNSTPYRPL